MAWQVALACLLASQLDDVLSSLWSMTVLPLFNRPQKLRTPPQLADPLTIVQLNAFQLLPSHDALLLVVFNCLL